LFKSYINIPFKNSPSIFRTEYDMILTAIYHPAIRMVLLRTVLNLHLLIYTIDPHIIVSAYIVTIARGTIHPHAKAVRLSLPLDPTP
jgi:hypothetical protein